MKSSGLGRRMGQASRPGTGRRLSFRGSWGSGSVPASRCLGRRRDSPTFWSPFPRERGSSTCRGKGAVTTSWWSSCTGAIGWSTPSSGAGRSCVRTGDCGCAGRRAPQTWRRTWGEVTSVIRDSTRAWSTTRSAPSTKTGRRCVSWSGEGTEALTKGVRRAAEAVARGAVRQLPRFLDGGTPLIVDDHGCNYSTSTLVYIVMLRLGLVWGPHGR